MTVALSGDPADSIASTSRFVALTKGCFSTPFTIDSVFAVHCWGVEPKAVSAKKIGRLTAVQMIDLIWFTKIRS